MRESQREMRRQGKSERVSVFSRDTQTGVALRPELRDVETRAQAGALGGVKGSGNWRDIYSTHRRGIVRACGGEK